MLTTSQRARCQQIAQALDAGDVAVYKRAEASLSPEMRGLIWDMRREQEARAAQQQKAASARPETELLSRDLDFWADDAPDDEPIDDDVPDDMPVCPSCRGTGRAADGTKCLTCNGKGRIPAEDQRDEDDEDADEKKSYAYEFQEE